MVYENYKGLVMKEAFDLLGDSLLAEKISRKVFVSFYQHMALVSEEGTKSWLMTVTRNTIVDCVGSQSAKKEKIMCGGEVGEEDILTPDTADKVLDKLANGKPSFRIMEDLWKKNKEWYEIIMAICIQEMEQKDVAEYLQITPQVLRAKLYRARKYIRDKYKDEYQGYA